MHNRPATALSSGRSTPATSGVFRPKTESSVRQSRDCTDALHCALHLLTKKGEHHRPSKNLQDAIINSGRYSFRIKGGYMMLRKCLSILVLTALTASAEGVVNTSNLKIGAWGWLTMGRVESSYTEGLYGMYKSVFDVDLNKEWLPDYNAGIFAVNSFNSTTKARFHLGLTTTYVVPNSSLKNVEFWRRIFALYLIDAAIERTVPINQDNKLFLEFGFFPVKYNPQVRNLGEYLFRSNVHPPVIVSGFELADKVKLIGFHGRYSLQYGRDNIFNLDAFLTTGMETYPIGNFSLSFLAGTDMAKIVDIGAGVCFYDLISIDHKKSEPASGMTGIMVHPQYFLFVDSITGDTTRYSFSGTKTMARLTFNPKKWFNSTIFGPEDLKLYAEAAILGMENHPGWYQNILERIPVMFGMNIPCFKLLDVLAVELQWFGSKYWNTTEDIWRAQSPVPYQGQAVPDDYYSWLQPKMQITQNPDGSDDTVYVSKAITDDDWKWSVYVTRTFNNRFRVSAQWACDNRSRSDKLPPPPQQSKYTEITRRSWKDWYWMVRFMYYL